MSRQRIKTTWNIPREDVSLRKFARYLRDKGIRPSTLDSYVFRVGRYLKFCGKEQPTQETAQEFRDHLMDNGLSRSSINNYCFAIRQFHRMQGIDFEFTFLKPHNEIPYYFTTDEVNRIFDEIHNIKHLAIFKTAFFACLRASEICNLDIRDLDLDRLTLRVVEGKGGKNAVLYLSDDASAALRSYLAVRPDLKIDGRSPLFFSDFGARIDRRDIHRLVINYKMRAGINKPGGAHVLFRHTPASIMVQNGCDLLTIQHVLRHNDIKTSMHYLHMADEAKRERYTEFLRL
jgi:site-specific recombinase XerD